MNILVINCGSSSLKFQLLDMRDETVLASGLVERIGGEQGQFAYNKFSPNAPKTKLAENRNFLGHSAALEYVLTLMTDPEWGVISSVNEINAVGHRVVQGGELLQRSCVVEAAEMDAISRLAELAPLHNPVNLQGIDVAKRLCPNAPSVAVFDTEFHARMEPESFRYALPTELYRELGIRRYGFHGASHSFVSVEAAKFLGRPLEDLRLITCHLGNGCSMAAVQNGYSVETSMGFTPLAGLVMGTRCGDIDPAIPLFLTNHKNMDSRVIDDLMNKKSGLLGLCGRSDMRDIHEARARGDADAELAFRIFCRQVKRYIGSCLAILGGLDALIFTAGIGENDPATRAACVSGLQGLGIAVDESLNREGSGPRRISPDENAIQILVIPTNEELAIARSTLGVLKNT